MAGINTSSLRKHYLNPDGFHSVISRLVIPMKPKKRHRRAVTTSVLISAEVIFSRIVGYLNSGRVEVTIVVALETELGPIPVALVDEKKGCVLRSKKSKSQERSSCRSIRAREKEDGHYHK